MSKFKIGFLSFIVGGIIGSHVPKTYYLSHGIGPGTKVHHKDEGSSFLAGKFYNFCEYGKVLFILDIHNVLVQWTNCKDHPVPKDRDGFLDIHDLDQLERAK